MRQRARSRAGWAFWLAAILCAVSLGGQAEAAGEAAQAAGETAQVAGEAAQAAGETAQVAGEAVQAVGEAAPAPGAPPLGGDVGAAATGEMTGAAAAQAAGTDDAAEARGPVTNLPLPRFVSLRAEAANARRGPGLAHRVDWAFQRRGWPLQVTAEYGHWRKVRDVEGAGGWVHHSLLSGARTAVFVGQSLVPLRASRSESSAVRAYAEPGVVARLEGCEQGWCRVGIERMGGWAPRDVLWGAD